jgi:hydroxyacylglutathione hydrolase
MLDIRLIPALSDNYIYLAHEPATGITAVVDPGEAEPVRRALSETGWKLTHILNTHHHDDHIGGDHALKAATGATIIGPRADRDRIPEIDVALGEGDSVKLGDETGTVFDTPGHTRGHIAFWFEHSQALFCGDTLFSLGCGRMFEGTAPQMWASLAKLRALPDDTRIYCGHEYTASNARFALAVDPDNAALRARAAEVERLRAAGKPTIPARLGEERATNPFLRADDPGLKAALGRPDAAPAEIFGELRSRKDKF